MTLSTNAIKPKHMPQQPEALPPDSLIPDPVVWREFGVTSMTGYRWSRDPALGFPPAVKINRRNFRSRRSLEEFKAKLLREAVAKRAQRVA